MAARRDERITDLIRSRKESVNIRRGYMSLMLQVLVLAAVAWALMSFVFLVTQERGNGMFPSLKDGDLIIAFRMQKKYVKNDVVVFDVNGKEQAGRIVACGNDVVTLDDTGTLTVNGTVQTGEIQYPTYAKEGFEYPLRVPEGHVYVLGDYRTMAEDSRDFGPVPVKNVEGKVITILRRRGL